MLSFSTNVFLEKTEEGRWPCNRAAYSFFKYKKYNNGKNNSSNMDRGF